jgi:hypothetical protein
MQMYNETRLLTKNNFKTLKGEKYGYFTYILYMSPATDNSQGINLCPHASAGCAMACLFTSGFGGMYEKVANGRRNKTEWFLHNRESFLLQLDKEISAIEKRVTNIERVCIRLNGTTDIRWEKFAIRDGKNIFELHPEIQFYDYTKNPKRFDIELPANYHLTFSRSEENDVIALQLLNRGVSVAMVFKKTPETYMGYPVINGDENDLRFLDPKGVVIGLKYKRSTGKGGELTNAEAYSGGFVIMN